MTTSSKVLKNAAMISAMAMACASLVGCTNKLEKFTEYLNAGDYEEAINVYSDWDISAQDKETLIEILRTKLAEIVDDYGTDTITYEQAVDFCTTVSQLYIDELEEDEINANATINTLNSSKEAFENGNNAFENGDYLSAIRYYDSVVDIDVNYETARSKKDEAIDKFVSKVIATADQYVAQNDYSGAYEYLESSAQKLEDRSAIDEKLDALHKQEEEAIAAQHKKEAVDSAKEFAKQDDLEGAINALTEYRETYDSDDAEINEMYDEYADSYVAFILEKVEALRSEEKYLQALTMLSNACLIVDSPEFHALEETINAEKPIYLCEVKCQNSDRYEQISEGEDVMDSLGNVYPVGNLFLISTSEEGWSSAEQGYADYYLGYKYNRLTGMVAVADTSSNVDCSISIEGDGVVLFTLDLNRLTVPTLIDIDVSKVNVLTIRSNEVSEDGTFYTILSDFIFEA